MSKETPTGEGQRADESDRQQYPTEDAPLPVRVVESPSDAADRKAREAKTDEHEAKDLKAQERSAEAAEKQVGIGVAAAVLSAVGLFFLMWTVRESRRASKAAIRAAKAAEDAVIDGRNSTERQLRAYVYLDRVKMDYVSLYAHPDGGNSATVTFKNYGTTPAIVTSVASYLIVAGRETTKKDGPAEVIGPGGASDMKVEWSMSESEMQSILSGASGLHCVCSISYRDILDRQRNTTMVWTYNASPRAMGFAADSAHSLTRYS